MVAPTILIADDDPDIRNLVADILAGEGYAVRTVADGREALEAVASDRPDLVVSDVVMPRLDGWSLAARLRQWTHPVPVVLMSGHCPAFAPVRVRCLAKPFDAATLVAVVAEVVGAPAFG
jgi:CheY-like chemotaxis protein